MDNGNYGRVVKLRTDGMVETVPVSPISTFSIMDTDFSTSFCGLLLVNSVLFRVIEVMLMLETAVGGISSRVEMPTGRGRTDEELRQGVVVFIVKVCQVCTAVVRESTTERPHYAVRVLEVLRIKVSYGCLH